ncbi:serine hydrolase [Psychrobacillus sp. FSL H8-0484]|uniref:serine hydrolase n=1 Tax=Psychrobacillus sp. FSL H8-0484 TaxID=2921390 RepID=UPI0030FC5867
MQNVIKKLKEIESGTIGILIYSSEKQKIVSEYNREMSFPLASAAKVAVGFSIAKCVEDKLFKWNDIVEDVNFNPNEDSKELFPHFQQRSTLSLREAVEVMIACHDSLVANSIVQKCGGWEKVNNKIKSYFQNINITQNPRNLENSGKLSQVFELLLLIFEGYRLSPDLWAPIINGLVRQRGDIDGIPTHFLNHMSGGLDNVVVDIGILGDLNHYPLLYVLGAKNLPNRSNFQFSDEKIIEAMKLLYQEYLNQSATNFEVESHK